MSATLTHVPGVPVAVTNEDGTKGHNFIVLLVDMFHTHFSAVYTKKYIDPEGQLEFTLESTEA